MDYTCPTCKKNQMTALLRNIMESDKIYQVYYCKDCNIGVTIPNPSEIQLSSLYSAGVYRCADGKRFVGLVEAGVYMMRHLRRKRVEEFVKKGRILDIGCGRGVFLNIMKRNGWTVAGTEYDPITAKYLSEKYGIPVATGNPKDCGFQPESFDVVTMNHVLEHMTAPETMIGESASLLRKGGLLVVAVPNINSLQSSFGKHLWFHLDIPHHLYHFTEKGLSSIVEKYNFNVVKVKYFDLEYNPFGWLQTLFNVTGIRKNFLYNLLKHVDSRRDMLMHASKRELLLTVFLFPLYFPLSFFLSLFESYILKRGGTIEIYALKA